jgi:phosphoglycerol transferase MdoB-like AlkP superfamily enzyme
LATAGMDIRNIEQPKSDNALNNLFYNMDLQWTQHWEVLSFLIIVAAKVLYYGKLISPGFFDPKLVQAPVVASILPLAAIAYLFKNKGRTRILYILNIIISIILFADTVYYSYFKDIISIGVIRDGLLLKDVSSSLGALIKPKDFVYFIDIILFIPLNMIMKRVNRKELSFRLRMMIFILMFSLGIIFDGNFIYKLSKEQPLLITTMSNKLYLTRALGNVNFHILDGYNFIANKISSSKSISDSIKNREHSFKIDDKVGLGLIKSDF